jgi:hypothetical protein
MARRKKGPSWLILTPLATLGVLAFRWMLKKK